MEQTGTKVMLFDEVRGVYILICLICGASCEGCPAEDDEYLEIELKHEWECALIVVPPMMMH